MANSDRQVAVTNANANTKPATRLGFLDALRGLAVLLVLIQHVGEQTWSAIPEISGHWLDIGQLGVMLFFCCSGFIIPVSLDRSGRLDTFWISRVFRLYPLYLVSVAGVFVGSRLFDMPTGAVTPTDWLANITMLQHFMGRPDAVGLYWSLAWEMLFYLVISGLFLFRAHRWPVLLSAGINTCLIIAVVVCWLVLPGMHFSVGLFNIALMFAGYAMYQWFAGKIATSVIMTTVGYTALTGAVILLATAFSGGLTDQIGTPRNAVPLGTAWLGALLIFSIVVASARSGLRFPGWLRRLGAISFSVYLMQSLVVSGIRFPDAPPWLTAVIWTTATLLVSELTYRFLEVPAITLGRRIVRSYPTRREPAKVTPPARSRPDAIPEPLSVNGRPAP